MKLEDSTPVQNSSLGQSLANPNWTIWTREGIPSITPLRGLPYPLPFFPHHFTIDNYSNLRVAGNDETSYRGTTSFDSTQGSSSRRPDYHPWQQWPEDTSTSLSNAQDPLSRSPVRIRGNLHDASQTTADVPRSSSPYGNFTVQAPVGQPSMTQSPPNTNSGVLENQTSFTSGITAGPLGQAYGVGNRLPPGMCLRPFCFLDSYLWRRANPWDFFVVYWFIVIRYHLYSIFKHTRTAVYTPPYYSCHTFWSIIPKQPLTLLWKIRPWNSWSRGSSAAPPNDSGIRWPG